MSKRTSVTADPYGKGHGTRAMDTSMITHGSNSSLMNASTISHNPNTNMSASMMVHPSHSMNSSMGLNSTMNSSIMAYAGTPFANQTGLNTSLNVSLISHNPNANLNASMITHAGTPATSSSQPIIRPFTGTDGLDLNGSPQTPCNGRRSTSGSSSGPMSRATSGSGHSLPSPNAHSQMGSSWANMSLKTIAPETLKYQDLSGISFHDDLNRSTELHTRHVMVQEDHNLVRQVSSLSMRQENLGLPQAPSRRPAGGSRQTLRYKTAPVEVEAVDYSSAFSTFTFGAVTSPDEKSLDTPENWIPGIPIMSVQEGSGSFALDQSPKASPAFSFGSSHQGFQFGSPINGSPSTRSTGPRHGYGRHRRSVCVPGTLPGQLTSTSANQLAQDLPSSDLSPQSLSPHGSFRSEARDRGSAWMSSPGGFRTLQSTPKSNEVQVIGGFGALRSPDSFHRSTRTRVESFSRSATSPN